MSRTHTRTRTLLTSLALTLIAAPAAVSVWAGWVGLGSMSGFGPVDLLPGIGEGFVINTAITLPIGVEAYAAMAMGVWLGRVGDRRAQRFARASAIGALTLGMFGQVAFHLLSATGATAAPMPVVVGVAVLPVAVLGSAGALVHMLNTPQPLSLTTTPAVVATQAPPEQPPAEPATVTTEPTTVTTEPTTVTTEPTTEPAAGAVEAQAPAEPVPATTANTVPAALTAFEVDQTLIAPMLSHPSEGTGRRPVHADLVDVVAGAA